MPKYDLETRKAAIQRYKLTDYKVAVCKEFNISRVTLDAWIKLEEETGGLSPKVANSRGAPSHIKDWIAFKYLLKIQNFKILAIWFHFLNNTLAIRFLMQFWFAPFMFWG
ncbi:MAG TPA: helix-turn-helix domain containing protein [Acinetobacter johnsonii]|nr:helix-turn-helix domain containing protein [Acinetobacter johnsonii]